MVFFSLVGKNWITIHWKKSSAMLIVTSFLLCFPTLWPPESGTRRHGPFWFIHSTLQLLDWRLWPGVPVPSNLVFELESWKLVDGLIISLNGIRNLCIVRIPNLFDSMKTWSIDGVIAYDTWLCDQKKSPFCAWKNAGRVHGDGGCREQKWSWGSNRETKPFVLIFPKSLISVWESTIWQHGCYDSYVCDMFSQKCHISVISLNMHRQHHSKELLKRL